MPPTFTRYSPTPFPPYRFRPGRHPHPTAHADGHSYHSPGQPHAPVEYRTAEAWRDSDDYLYGCDLYNHGYWWEAHEAWEGLWQLTDKKGYQGQFLQTLIQAGACHLKLELQRMDGVISLRASSRSHLEQTCAAAPQAVIMGLDIMDWYARVDTYWTTRVAIDPLAHDYAAYPYITLPV